MVVWPSNRNRLAQESQVSSEWIKWHSKREERDGQDQLEDANARMMETQRTAVEQKAKNYLQENARKNFIEQVEEEQIQHRKPVAHSPPAGSSPARQKQISPPAAAFSPKKDHGEDQVIESKPPQYDFEKLIEKALQEAGEEVPTQSHISSNNRVANKGQGAKKKVISEKERKKKEQAAALLEKRKKYDPRKALKKGSKTAKAKKEVAKEFDV